MTKKSIWNDALIGKEVSLVEFHPNILTILFENRRYVTKIFRDIIGFYGIDHISITIIDPSNEAIVFSTTPDIEYNLINQDLWRNDCLFSCKEVEDDIIVFWNKDNNTPYLNKIYDIKHKKNNYNLGMTLVRKVGGFCLLYSFATRSKDGDLKEYYLNNIGGLTNIGDHFYKSIRDIYLSYCKLHVPPNITNFKSLLSMSKNKPYLKLVVDNINLKGHFNE